MFVLENVRSWEMWHYKVCIYTYLIKSLFYVAAMWDEFNLLAHSVLYM